MQTVDMVIAGVGVAAILATTLGLVFYDEAAGIDEVTFQELEGPTFGEEATQSPGETTYGYVIPMNGTAASVDVSLSVERLGSGVGPYSGSFSAYLAHPNGNVSQPFSDTYSFGNQAGSAQASVTIPLLRFFEVPATTNTTDLATFDMSHDWNGTEVQVVVTITGASPTTPGGLNPTGNSFAYTVTTAGQFLVYEHVRPAIPDPTTA